MCAKPVNGICPAPDPKYDNIRDNLGYTLRFANRMKLASMMPHGDLASTDHCLADPGAEYLVYAPSGGTFTVNLSAARSTLRAEWFNPDNGKSLPAGMVQGGQSAQSFTAPFKGDAILYLSGSTNAGAASSAIGESE